MAILYQPYDLGQELDPRDVPLDPEMPPQDEAALRLVVKDLNLAEYYVLAKGLTVSWDRDDRLYLFRMPQAFWEGSSVPRASLGIPLIFEHIESLMPQVMSSLFSDKPPFDITAKGETSPETARAIRCLIQAQLEAIGFEEQMRLGLKEALVYGTGIWKYGWAEKEGRQISYKYSDIPEPVSTSTGVILMPKKYPRPVKELLEEYTYHEPWFERVHIRFMVCDPSLREPDIRKAKYVIHRTYPDISDLECLRNQPGYTIPSTAFLQSLFRPPRESPERSLLEGRSTSSVLNTGISSLDINMEFRAMPRWQDPSRDPNQQPLELCEYTTDKRVITVLNRKVVVKNDSNPLGKINYLSCSFADVIDSWYGLGISHLLAGEQRLQQGVINSRLDDLALRLSGTFIRTRGANTPTQQLRMRPGGIIDSDDAKGIQMIQYPPAIVDAFTEIEASDSRAQRRTGANQLVTQGTAPTAGQLGRTSAGIQTANAALGARMGYWLDQITGLVFLPFIEAVHEMNSLWLPQEEIKDFFDENVLTDMFKPDPMEIKNATLRFSILAGAKLQKRQAMLQLAPVLTQMLMIQPVLEAVSEQQKKVDWVELMQILLDASGWPGMQKLIIDMSQQDKQNQMQKQQSMMQNTQIMLKHQAAMQEIEQKARGQAGVNIVKGWVEQLDPQNRMAALQQLKDLLAPPGQESDQRDSGQPGGQPPSGGGQELGGGGGGSAMGNL